MMIEEFNNRIARKGVEQVGLEDYKIIEKVYNNHPSIRDNGGKEQIAMLYMEFGMRVIKDMLPTAERAAQLHDKIRSLKIQINELQNELEELG